MSGENLDEEKRNKSKIRIELYSDNTRLFMDKQDNPTDCRSLLQKLSCTRDL